MLRLQKKVMLNGKYMEAKPRVFEWSLLNSAVL